MFLTLLHLEKNVNKSVYIFERIARIKKKQKRNSNIERKVTKKKGPKNYLLRSHATFYFHNVFSFILLFFLFLLFFVVNLRLNFFHSDIQRRQQFFFSGGENPYDAIFYFFTSWNKEKFLPNTIKFYYYPILINYLFH